MRAVFRGMTLAVLVAAALNAAAALTQYKEWDKSPEYQLLATDAERKDWKKVSTDEEAGRFLALFWARRDPDLKTPVNEFKIRFDALVAKADELFTMGKRRGALSERGRLFILVGPPKGISKRSERALGTTTAGALPGEAVNVTYTFVYGQEQLPAWAGTKVLTADITVDLSTQSDSLVEAGPVRRLEKMAPEAYIVNKDLKEAPVFKTKEQVEAEQKAANEAAAELAKGPALTPPVKEVLEGLMAKEPAGPLALLPLAYRDGATRLMAQLFAAASAVPAPEGVKLAILVRDRAGKDQARVEEPAALQKTKGDFFTDRALRVLPGDYDVSAGLFDGADKPLVTARRAATVPLLPTEFGTSPLFVAYNDFPSASVKAEDAFTFSARKFVSHGDGHIDATDGLSYAVRVYNPSVDPVTKTMTIRRTLKIKPKNGPPIEVPRPEDQPAPAPPEVAEGKTKAVIDLAGSIVETNLGEYFKPGEYELRLTVTDVVSGKKFDLATPYTLTGTLALPAKPAPSPAPAPKKK